MLCAAVLACSALALPQMHLGRSKLALSAAMHAGALQGVGAGATGARAACSSCNHALLAVRLCLASLSGTLFLPYAPQEQQTLHTISFSPSLCGNHLSVHPGKLRRASCEMILQCTVYCNLKLLTACRKDIASRSKHQGNREQRAAAECAPATADCTYCTTGCWRLKTRHIFPAPRPIESATNL